MRARLASLLTSQKFEISLSCDSVQVILHWKPVEQPIQEVPLARTLAIRRINPIGRLPHLEHDGRFVADSTNDAHYLEEKFPERSILLQDPPQRPDTRSEAVLRVEIDAIVPTVGTQGR